MQNLTQQIAEIKNPVKFIYFDLGGVVFNFSGGLEAISQKLNVSLNEITSYWKSQDDLICQGKLDPQKFWGNLLKYFSIPYTNFDFLDFWINHFIPILETHNTMKILSKNNIQIGILTNIYPGVFEKASEKNFIPKIPFSSIVKSCQLGLVKPDPQIFQFAQDRTLLKPSEILFIDDRIENILVAEKFNWNTIHFIKTNS